MKGIDIIFYMVTLLRNFIKNRPVRVPIEVSGKFCRYMKTIKEAPDSIHSYLHSFLGIDRGDNVSIHLYENLYPNLFLYRLVSHWPQTAILLTLLDPNLSKISLFNNCSSSVSTPLLPWLFILSYFT